MEIKCDHVCAAQYLGPGCTLNKYLILFSNTFWMFTSIFHHIGKEGRWKVTRSPHLWYQVLWRYHPRPHPEAVAAGNLERIAQ